MRYICCIFWNFQGSLERTVLERILGPRSRHKKMLFWLQCKIFEIFQEFALNQFVNTRMYFLMESPESMMIHSFHRKMLMPVELHKKKNHIHHKQNCRRKIVVLCS